MLRALIHQVAARDRQITQLETTLAVSFEQHPDTDIYHSLPGFGVVLGARALGEFGDDPNRYANPKARRNYAGTSPPHHRVREEDAPGVSKRFRDR